MRNRGSKEWIGPPPDQWITLWGLLTITLIITITSWGLDLLAGLVGVPWICCYLFGISLAAVGAGLIFYAKLPLYRQRRFFRFGPRALPEQRRPFYRWGYICVLLGVLLLACLLLSRN